MSRKSSVRDRVEKDSKASKVVKEYLKKESDVNKGVNNDVNKGVNNDVNKGVNNDVNKGVNNDVNKGGPVIKSVPKKLQPKRATYYLKPETIKKINELSEETGVGKSDIVQQLLDDGLKKAIIE